MHLPVCVRQRGRGGREREVCFRLMCLTPQHLHQAHHKVNRSHTHTHTCCTQCALLSGPVCVSKGLMLHQNEGPLNDISIKQDFHLFCHDFASCDQAAFLWMQGWYLHKSEDYCVVASNNICKGFEISTRY